MSKSRYSYSGPVMVNNKIATMRWRGEVIAVTEDAAVAGLKYEFKKTYKDKVDKDARIVLVGKIKRLENVL